MLDEIGEMPLELQPKLLRVLQERVYYRLGSEKAQEADFRLICATNRDPLTAIREGQLREDLYYRINTIEISVPPLQARAEDVQRLAEHFLKIYAEKYQRPVNAISQEAYERMFEYAWPGNVRELQNVIERAVLLCKGEILAASVLPFTTPLIKSVPPPIVPVVSNVEIPTDTATVPLELNPEEPMFKQLGHMIISRAPKARAGETRFDLFEELEGAIVSAALERTRGNKQAAATLLGVYRPRLYHMLRKHNLHQLASEEKDPPSH